MAKTRYYAAATLDGYIADSDDGIEWLQTYDEGFAGSQQSVGDAMQSFMDEIGSLLMGSATYEFIQRHGNRWSYGDRPTWVLTSRDLERIESADLRFHDGEVDAVLNEAQDAAGERDLWVVGGGSVASQLEQAGLLDELQVTVVPVILGSGKPLFAEPPRRPMKLLGTRAYSNGMS
jgi:dihydrofolate reductase